MLSDEDHHYSNVAVKNDIEQLNSSKVLLEEDVKKLRDERHKLNEQLKMIQSKISSESIRYDNLVAEISELQIQKTKITNENKDLIEQQKIDKLLVPLENYQRHLAMTLILTLLHWARV